ncbi:hypothetical protein ACJMK2_020354 [Sinanodonta woodiana]|uniref:Nbr1 FW domain-containing protein n=1 Tax=Sinanodonta woodiana TaxID=1069815 RepID=A0ABD3U0I9_SINWO
MDVDNDVDGRLLQQFSSMGTTDKEVLIAEFQRLLGNQLTPSICAFFLDMNNWNLQAAIGAYYDLDQPNIRPLSMIFVRDITIGDGEAVPPSTKFTKTWRIKNSGDEMWPPGCNLRFCTGDNLSNTDRVIVDMIPPGEETNVSVEMQSPASPGVYQSQWRMNTPTGLFFGDPIWVIITVEENGLLGVTQQLSKIGNDFVRHSAPEHVPNPFASPGKHREEDNTLNSNASMVMSHGNPYSTELNRSPNRNLALSVPSHTPAGSFFQSSESSPLDTMVQDTVDDMS